MSPHQITRERCEWFDEFGMVAAVDPTEQPRDNVPPDEVAPQVEAFRLIREAADTGSDAVALIRRAAETVRKLGR